MSTLQQADDTYLDIDLYLNSYREQHNGVTFNLPHTFQSSELNICASAYLTWLKIDDGQGTTSCDRSWGSVNHILDLLCAQRGSAGTGLTLSERQCESVYRSRNHPRGTMSYGAQTPCVRERYVTLAIKPHACLNSPNSCRLFTSVNFLIFKMNY